MSVGQKLAMLKMRSTSVTFLSLGNLEAAPEEAMQLRRLIKSSNESLGPYLFGKIEFWNFQGPTAEIPGLRDIQKFCENFVFAQLLQLKHFLPYVYLDKNMYVCISKTIYPPYVALLSNCPYPYFIYDQESAREAIKKTISWAFHDITAYSHSTKMMIWTPSHSSVALLGRYL